MDCTTLARVQAVVPRTDATADAVLTRIIASVSTAFEKALYRYVQSTERTEVYPLRPTARIISLKGSPCTVTDSGGTRLATFEVKLSASHDFASSPTLVRNTEYVIEQDRGVLRILGTPDGFVGPSGRQIAPSYVRVKYTGGLAATTDALISAYPDIAAACDTQVVYEFKRRTEPGASDNKAGDSGTTHSEDVKLLKGVLEILGRYKRRGG